MKLQLTPKHIGSYQTANMMKYFEYMMLELLTASQATAVLPVLIYQV